jgi:4'-phosphopantetheinyl transferase
MNRKPASNRVDLWLLPIQSGHSASISLDKAGENLTIEEFKRYQKYKVNVKKDEFLASRMLLRHLLTSYAGCDPDSVKTVIDSMGRPFWYEKNHQLPLFFSLSHTAGMVCCALGEQRQIGCDVERLTPRKYWKELRRKVFSQRESVYCDQLEATDQMFFFYRSWTLKEAFVKAVGKGLRIPFSGLSFHHEPAGERWAAVERFCLGKEQGKEPWYFYSGRIKTDYQLSFATTISNPQVMIHRATLRGTKIIEK